MIETIFLVMAFAFVIVAALAAVATMSTSRTVSAMANRVANGSSAVALALIALSAWFIYWPPA